MMAPVVRHRENSGPSASGRHSDRFTDPRPRVARLGSAPRTHPQCSDELGGDHAKPGSAILISRVIDRRGVLALPGRIIALGFSRRTPPGSVDWLRLRGCCPSACGEPGRAREAPLNKLDGSTFDQDELRLVQTLADHAARREYASTAESTFEEDGRPCHQRPVPSCSLPARTAATVGSRLRFGRIATLGLRLKIEGTAGHVVDAALAVVRREVPLDGVVVRALPCGRGRYADLAFTERSGGADGRTEENHSLPMLHHLRREDSPPGTSGRPSRRTAEHRASSVRIHEVQV
jgi:hypothetical protein